MSQLKILISAFCCRPHRGSEQGIGWNVALEMAKRHRVWVVTDSSHREVIEPELARNPSPNLKILYHGLPSWISFGSENLYRHLWQLTAFLLFRRMHRAVGFDLAHHVTLVRYWSPSLLCLLGIPFIWGPVGGGELIADRIRRDLPLRHRFKEWRKAAVLRVAVRDPLVRLTARNSHLALANTAQTAEKVRRLGGRRVMVMGESALDRPALAPPRGELPRERAVRFVTMTGLFYWKGVDLGLEAFSRLKETDAVYWIFGEGSEEKSLRQLALRLGIEKRVHFQGNASREEWLAGLRNSDVLVHACLCNSGGMISLEAMAAGLPVICLDTGGIAAQVSDDSGIKIPVRERGATVQGIANAMTRLAADHALRQDLGLNARARAERFFSWERKGEILDRLYRNVATVSPRESGPASDEASADDLEDLRFAGSEPHWPV